MKLSEYTLPTVLEWSHGGVNNSYLGNGGPECAAFLSLARRSVETILAVLISIAYTYWGIKLISLPPKVPHIR